MILTPGLSERQVKMIDQILTSNTDEDKSDESIKIALN